MPGNLHDPGTWPADTIVVRCGSAQGVQELADRLSRDGAWSVFTGPGVPFAELARRQIHGHARDDEAIRAPGAELTDGLGHDLTADGDDVAGFSGDRHELGW